MASLKESCRGTQKPGSYFLLLKYKGSMPHTKTLNHNNTQSLTDAEKNSSLHLVFILIHQFCFYMSPICLSHVSTWTDSKHLIQQLLWDTFF